MEYLTGYRLKIVERAGMKLENILHKSNPWSGENCERKSCLLCETKLKTEKKMSQSCSKRNLTYKTWCHSCTEVGKNGVLDEAEGAEDEKRSESGLYAYVGESSRSCFERAAEHVRDRVNYNKGSHMLKHIIEMHGDTNPDLVEFRMDVVKYHQSAFERQVFESLKIQTMRKKNILLRQ